LFATEDDSDERIGTVVAVDAVAVAESKVAVVEAVADVEASSAVAEDTVVATVAALKLLAQFPLAYNQVNVLHIFLIIIVPDIMVYPPPISQHQKD